LYGPSISGTWYCFYVPGTVLWAEGRSRTAEWMCESKESVVKVQHAPKWLVVAIYTRLRRRFRCTQSTHRLGGSSSRIVDYWVPLLSFSCCCGLIDSGTMSSRAQKKAAMEKFRSAKRKRELGEEGDIFEGNIKEEEDVYEYVDEQEYANLVNSRRQREDFVVDDGKSSLFCSIKSAIFYSFVAL
jgi:hypothetical protein